MKNYSFTFGDFNSNDYAAAEYGGMIVTNIPPARFPAKRTSTVALREGESIIETGLEAYNLPITVAFTRDPAYIDEVKSMIVNDLMQRGEDWLTLSNSMTLGNSRFKIRARVIDAVFFEKNLKFQQAVITFRCQPYRYGNVPPESVAATSIELENNGNVPAYPVIKFTNGILIQPSEGYYSIHRIEKVYEAGAVVQQTESDIAKIYSLIPTSFVLDGITGRAYGLFPSPANMIYVGDLPDVPPNLDAERTTTVTYSITCQNPSVITGIEATFYERWL